MAVDAGADALGFVFAESPRRISVNDACAITESVPDSVMRVAVMRTPSAAEWAEVAAGFRPDCLQMEATHFAALADVKATRALPVFRDTPDLDERAVIAEAEVLFEGAQSGRGQTADWSRAARLARATRVVLAGGLTPDNVGAAIETVRPWGVDVSSGVESRPGHKDHDRILAFLTAARSAQARYVH